MSTDSAEVVPLAGQRVREAGQVYTKGRRELVALLSEFGRPATIPDLLELGPVLTQSSMYRNMVDLEAAGVVQRIVGGDDRAYFELAEDLIGHHHHLICTECGAIEDFVVSAATERSLDYGLAYALAGSGFHPTSHRLDILGICAQCQGKPADQGTRDDLDNR